MWQHVVNQQGSTICHSTGATTGTETPSLTAECYELLIMARSATDPKKTMFQLSTFDKFVKFLCNKIR
jgi:hypothetical protein